MAWQEDFAATPGWLMDGPLREPVARALLNEGVALGGVGRAADAIAAYDDLLARFGAAPEPALRDLVAKARSARDDSRRS